MNERFCGDSLVYFNDKFLMFIIKSVADMYQQSVGDVVLGIPQIYKIDKSTIVGTRRAVSAEKIPKMWINERAGERSSPLQKW